MSGIVSFCVFTALDYLLCRLGCVHVVKLSSVPVGYPVANVELM